MKSVSSRRSQIARCFAVCLFSLLGIGQVNARLACPCTLTWAASASSSTAGYAVYYGVNGSSVTNRLDVGAVQSATIATLDASSNYFFFVVAYDVNGSESEPSNVLQYAPPAMSSIRLAQLTDGTMRINFRAGVGTTCRVEFADSLGSSQWITLNTATADGNGNVAIDDSPTGRPAMRFYRGVLP